MYLVQSHVRTYKVKLAHLSHKTAKFARPAIVGTFVVPLHTRSLRRQNMNTSTHLSPSYGGWPRWPTPLSSQINPWLWLSLALSISVPTTCAIHQLSHPPAKDTIKIPFGSGQSLIVALGVITALYNTFLLFLSRKEHRLTTSEEGMEDIEDVAQTAHMRSTLSLLIVAVCQSFLATLFLYVGVRLIFLLRAPVQHTSMSHPLLAYGDFGFVLGQMLMMGYVIFHCVHHEAKIETYLAMQEFRDQGEGVMLRSR
ncbi:hypothetical protein BDN70DRAFT_876077 [Pholiota conissans]|uniref:Uncharacterized protein n=1 Tax=Pholiota conissans TaxID=109636 RepID=A0A9P5Z553_9AGAR|nr:hypothetical protein BDN70DRAFT_876077 [Pholiota conissans]